MAQLLPQLQQLHHRPQHSMGKPTISTLLSQQRLVRTLSVLSKCALTATVAHLNYIITVVQQPNHERQ